MSHSVSESSNEQNLQESPSSFPQTIVTVSREEFVDAIPLTIRDGQGNPTKLPIDLKGHLYVVSPAGSPDSSTLKEDDQVVWVTKDGWTPIFNGDGLVYRVSFEQDTANLKTNLLKPPCYYADLATSNQANGNYYQDLAFENLGISRISLNRLGSRNQLNTAFLPFKLPDESSDRLLVTWDVGRPYEIDPETLEILNPVGQNDDWMSLLRKVPSYPFKQVMSSAHPVADPHTGEVFTVNIGKSIWTMLGLRRSLQKRWTENTADFSSTIKNSALPQDLQRLFSGLYKSFLKGLSFFVWIAGIIEKICRFFGGGYDFVHLVAWDGKKVDIKGKWHLVLSKNRSIKIDQTIHQIGLTKKYIVLAETSFKFSMENLLPYQRDVLATDLKILLADFLDYPQFPNTKLYIVKREDLSSAQVANKFWNLFSRSPSKNIPKVIAKEVTIEPEFSHCLVDYDDADDRIVLYISHLAATDVAEYVRIFDRSAFDDRDLDHQDDPYDNPDLTARLHQLSGNLVGPMDASRLGRWVINGVTGEIAEEPQLVSETELTWSTAFYAGLDPKATDKYTDIFWNNWGCWSDTYTERNVAAYKNYPNSSLPWKEVLDIAYVGVPSSLCHLKIREDDQGQTRIEIDECNRHIFKKHQLGTSAQFIPRPNAKSQIDGYIICIVLTSDEFLSASQDPDWSQNSEIWIFDAQELSDGPMYKLSHPKLNIGFTTHTTWLAEAKSPAQTLNYNVKDDHEHLVQRLMKEKPEYAAKIRQIFDREIYPNC